MEPYEIWASSYQALTYDLQAAIDEYTAALTSHALTVGVAAPTATSMVENIVKHHDGLFVIVSDPQPAEQQPLPANPKYYKSKADQIAIKAAIDREIKDKADFKVVEEIRRKTVEQAE